MSNFLDNFIGGFAFGMLANNPFFGGCFGFGMYPMFGRVDFGGFANPFPSVFGNMGYSSMAAQIPPSTFANAGFPVVDFRGVCQTIWDTYADPDSDYNKQMREYYKQMQEQSNKSDSSDKRQYIPQIQFPFSSFYMPSSVSMNPWVTGFPRQYSLTDKSTKKEDEKTESKEISSSAKDLKSKWSKKQPQLSDEFYSKVIKISQKVKCSPDDLMALMNLETAKTFSPSVKCGISSATGLIQFTDDAAKDLGTTTSKLAQMSSVKQLDYVERYLLNWKKQSGFKDSDSINAGVLYALVFQPAKTNNEILASSGTEEYRKNKSLDVNNDGKITKEDLAKKLLDFSA